MSAALSRFDHRTSMIAFHLCLALRWAVAAHDMAGKDRDAGVPLFAMQCGESLGLASGYLEQLEDPAVKERADRLVFAARVFCLRSLACPGPHPHSHSQSLTV